MGDEDSPAFNNPELVETLATGNIRFALDLYKRVCPVDSNVLLCPLSVSSILAMTLGGARNDTADQMKETMQLTSFEEDEFIHLAFQDVLSSLPQDADESGIALLTANRLFIQQDFEVTDDFKTLLEQHYSSEVQGVDFAQDADEARATINTWVSERTGEKFPELVNDGMLDMFSTLVLINAVYFKGQWESQFEAMATKLRPFMAGGGRKAVVDMMHQHGSFRMSESEDLQCKAIEIPYIGRRLRMVIVLPNDNDGLASLEETLDGEKLSDLLGGLEEAPANMTIPRFHVECGFSLSDVISELGMPNLFVSEAADLSGMSEGEGLFVSAVMHRALVEVGERGSEAAASLSSSIDYDAPSCEEGEVEFIADHPFLFLIHDTASGLVLFIGRLRTPATEELIP